MSLGYAERLSFREDLGGQLGDKEHLDPPAALEKKALELAEQIRAARRVFLFTGAGISTSCGVPDFRGPNGIWTLQRQGKPIPKYDISFAHVRPSLTHMVISALVRIYP